MSDYEKRMRRVAIEALQVITSIDRSAPTEFSFGYVDSDNHFREGLVIKKCVPVVISTLVEKGYILSMTEHGLLIDNTSVI